MTPLTALDLARIKFRRLDAHKHSFECPSCGGVAWAGSSHLQCTSRECKHHVFSPLDILQLVWKVPYAECAATSASMIGRRPDIALAASRKVQRLVLDSWFNLCRLDRTTAEALTADALARQGLDTANLGLSAAVVDSEKLRAFIGLAEETGASYPDHWRTDPPRTSLIYCVQSTPHTIDRIVVCYGKSTNSIIWNKRRGGFSGLLDADPNFLQLLTASKFDALRLQQKLRKTGHVPHIISVFNDTQAEFTDDTWVPDEIPLIAVVSNTSSLISIQRAIDQFPGTEDSLMGTTETSLLDLTPGADPVPWNSLRLKTIERFHGPGCKRVDQNAAHIFEQTGSRPDDAAFLVDRFVRDGRLELAESMRRLAENHIIYQDTSCTVKESYNSYRFFTKHEAREVANFSLRLKASVIFGDVHSEVYYQGVVGHGSKKTEALVSRTALESVKHLQQELQVVAAGGDGVIPTVIDVGHMRGKVMPYLSAQAAKLPVIRGISFLGWSADRKFFQAAGTAVNMDGTKKVPAVFHPALQQLRPFKSVEVWGDACPEIPMDARALVAMILALVVRSYKRCTLHPIKVIQSSDALTLLQGIMEAVGQESILELNANARDVRMQHHNAIIGYPCVAAGYSNQQINQSTTSYIILSDEGFSVDEQITKQDAEDAGRAVQFALIRLVEWCIATQADEFREVASTDWHNTLMLEGQWLMEHVCAPQQWEVRANAASELERVFSQIPLTQIHERMVILNGTTLRVDCGGLEIDREGVTRECDAMGAACSYQDDLMLIPAAQIITAVHRFYGRDPGIKAVLG